MLEWPGKPVAPSAGGSKRFNGGLPPVSESRLPFTPALTGSSWALVPSTSADLVGKPLTASCLDL